MTGAESFVPSDSRRNMAAPVVVDEDALDTLSHISSEQGDVPQMELDEMRRRIRGREVDTKRMLSWLEEAEAAETAAEQPGSAAVGPAQEDEPGFQGGKREHAHIGEVPFGRTRPALHARVEVEFEDFIYCGTVMALKGTTACTVQFDADGEDVDIKCGEHRFRTIQRAEDGASAAAVDSEDTAQSDGKAAPEPRRTPLKRKRGGDATDASVDTSGGAGPPSSQERAAKDEPSPESEAAAAAEGSSSAPESSGGFAVSDASPESEEASGSGHVELSQATSELVGGVTNDLNASLEQIGMFLTADCAEKEGQG